MPNRTGSHKNNNIIDGASESPREQQQPEQTMGQQHQKTPNQGNLDNALNNFNHNESNGEDHDVPMQAQDSHQQNSEHPSLLTIQIPSGTRIQTSKPTSNKQDRDRSSTFGSEFESYGTWAKERGMSLSCLLTPMGEDEGNLPGTMGNEEGTNATVSTSSTASALPVPQLETLHPMPSLMETKEGTDSQHKPFSHTPPTNVATSYEQRHFQKRMRAGSISGRLRSASDLEDIGIISNDQKAILKDLLIAGDNDVQAAIDKYEAGDASALEEMISSGAFSKSIDVDLLGDLDLDLDFLNVHEDDGLVFGNMDDVNIAGHDDSQTQQQGIVQNRRVGKVLAPRDSTSADGGIRHSGGAADEDAVNRIRTNSLALPGMMLDGANQDYTLGGFGHWMDSDLPNLINSKQSMGSNNASIINADGSSGSFQMQCDLLMQKDIYSSSPAAVRSILMDRQSSSTETKPVPLKSEPPNNDKKKKTKSKKDSSTDVKKPKKKASGPNEAYSTESIPFIKRQHDGDDDDDKKEVESGLGRPRSMSDPNLNVRIDDSGLLHVQGPEGWVGAYSPDSREIRVKKFLEKRNHRVWVKKVKYDVRKNFADSRLRVKGRFVKKEDEMLMRELMSLT